MAKLATFLRSRQKGWELDRYEFSPWWHKYSMFLNSFLPNLQGEKYSFAEVTLTRLVPFWGDFPKVLLDWRGVSLNRLKLPFWYFWSVPFSFQLTILLCGFKVWLPPPLPPVVSFESGKALNFFGIWLGSIKKDNKWYCHCQLNKRKISKFQSGLQKILPTLCCLEHWNTHLNTFFWGESAFLPAAGWRYQPRQWLIISQWSR